MSIKKPEQCASEETRRADPQWSDVEKWLLNAAIEHNDPRFQDAAMHLYRQREKVVELRATLEERTRELRETQDALILAIEHDRQPYPTADAYEAVCKALMAHKADLRAAEATLTAALRKATESAFDAGYTHAVAVEQDCGDRPLPEREDAIGALLEAALTASPAAKKEAK